MGFSNMSFIYTTCQTSYDKTLILVFWATNITALSDRCILVCNKSTPN